MRRRTRRQRSDVDDRPSFLKRVPAGVYWTLLAFVVLGLVLSYDQREQKEAKDHVALAQQLVKDGKFDEALSEYRMAFENERFGRRKRGEVAIHMAQLYMEKVGNIERADQYFAQARHLAPKLADEPLVRAQIVEVRQQLAAKSGQPGGPADPKSGPVVATIGDDDVYAGEITAALSDRSDFDAVVATSDTARLKELVEEYVNQNVIYLAALESGIHEDPMLLDKAEQYRRNLVIEAYLRNEGPSGTITADAVKDYYNANRSKFESPARLSVGIIKTGSSKAAEGVLEALRASARFEDVATSFSVDAASSGTKGLSGFILETDPTFPGLGKDPALFAELMKMKPSNVTKPIERDGAFYVIKVMSVIPKRVITLDEARASIDATLRKGRGNATGDIAKKLREKYKATVRDEGLSQYFTLLKDRQTTGSEQGSIVEHAQASSPSGEASPR